MLVKRTKPGISRALVILLLLGIALMAVGCSAAPSRGWCGPLVSDNVLYVGTYQGKILAFDLVTADKMWAEPVAQRSGGGGLACSGSVSTAMAMYGSPAIWKDRLYLGAYDGSVLFVSLDGPSVSLSTFKTSGHIVGSVAIYGDTLYVGSTGGKLYALDLNVADLSQGLKDGWPFETDGEIWSTPVVSNGVVYIASADHNLYAVDAESGAEIWRFETDAAIMSTPLVENGMVYIGGCNRNFYSIKAASEDERAAVAAGADPTVRGYDSIFEDAGNWFWTQALLHNGEIWVGCLDHRIYVLNAETLLPTSDAIKTDGMVYAPPLLFPSEGLVVVGSQDGRLYVVNAETKDVTVYGIDAKTEGVYELPEKPANRISPILAPMYADTVNGVVYLHAQNGYHTLYAFKLATKEVLWSFRTDKISD